MWVKMLVVEAVVSVTVVIIMMPISVAMVGSDIVVVSMM